MIKGIYASGSGMQPRMMKLEVVANNIANANSTAFKKDNLFIQVMKDAGLTMTQGQGELKGLDCKEYTDFTEGSFVQTDNPLNFGIQGRGFFVVDTPEGTRYTRNGNFSMSTDGTVVTEQGYPVMGSSGKIQIPQPQKISETTIAVNERGEITMGNVLLGKIRVVDFEDLNQLKKAGGSLFETSADEKAATVDGKTLIVRQGYLEESNVEGIEEMIHLVELTRSFETDQRTLQVQDTTLERAIEVGRI
jgi:flagellar basal-body rod protein FlgG